MLQCNDASAVTASIAVAPRDPKHSRRFNTQTILSYENVLVIQAPRRCIERWPGCGVTLGCPVDIFRKGFQKCCSFKTACLCAAVAFRYVSNAMAVWSVAFSQVDGFQRHQGGCAYQRLWRTQHGIDLAKKSLICLAITRSLCVASVTQATCYLYDCKSKRIGCDWNN